MTKWMTFCPLFKMGSLEGLHEQNRLVWYQTKRFWTLE